MSPGGVLIIMFKELCVFSRTVWYFCSCVVHIKFFNHLNLALINKHSFLVKSSPRFPEDLAPTHCILPIDGHSILINRSCLKLGISVSKWKRWLHKRSFLESWTIILVLANFHFDFVRWNWNVWKKGPTQNLFMTHKSLSCPRNCQFPLKFVQIKM